MNIRSLLRGKQVVLTAITEDDLPIMAVWENDSQFLRLQSSNPAYPYSAKQLEDWLERYRDAENAYVFAIRERGATEGGREKLLGTVSIDEIEWKNRVGELGIGVGNPATWGRGVGYEASRLAIDFAFDELALHRLQLDVFEYNTRAIALYEKLGFRREGTFREYIHRDGSRFDMHLYGLLRHEWAERRSP